MTVPLSGRIRPNSEAAPWVLEEIKTLEAEVERLKGKLMEEARRVYDTGQRAKDALAEVERLKAVLDEERALACEEPDPKCSCPGCSYAREKAALKEGDR